MYRRNKKYEIVILEDQKLSLESIERLREEIKNSGSFTDREIRKIIRRLQNMNHQIDRLSNDLPIQITLATNPTPLSEIECGDIVGVADEWEMYFLEVVDSLGDDLYVGVIKNHLLSYELDDNIVPYNRGNKIFFEISNVLYGQI